MASAFFKKTFYLFLLISISIGNFSHTFALEGFKEKNPSEKQKIVNFVIKNGEIITSPVFFLTTCAFLKNCKLQFTSGNNKSLLNRVVNIAAATSLGLTAWCTAYCLAEGILLATKAQPTFCMCYGGCTCGSCVKEHFANLDPESREKALVEPYREFLSRLGYSEGVIQDRTNLYAKILQNDPKKRIGLDCFSGLNLMINQASARN